MKMTYELWMKSVNRILEKKTGGLDQEMLPDWLSRDAYESDMTPEEGADECLYSAGWDFESDEVLDEL